MNLTTQPTEATHLEAPHFIDIRSEPLRTTILCGGLPYHRRIGLRKLDTLLIVQGETARRFCLGVGIDLPNTMSAALGFLTPKTTYFPAAPPPTMHGWLFHLDRRNVIATHWEPLWERVQGSGVRGQGSGHSGQSETASGFFHPSSFIPHPSSSIVGFRVRLLETEGRNTQLGLRSFRPIAAAQKIEPGETSPIQLSIEGDQINIPIQAFQILDVEVIF